MDNINDYNNNLINNHIDIELINYFKEIHSKFYNKVDISFMDYFLEICNKENEFCIDHIKLQEYNVINNINTSKDIKVCLNQFNLEENIDYLVGNIPQSRLENKHGGSNGNKKEYKLTPYAFKICLIRAKNSKVYVNYYLLLEIIFKNYNEYRIQYQKNIIKNISKENKTLHEKIDEQSKNIKDQSTNIEKLMKYAKDTNEIVHELNIKIDELLKLVHQFLSNQINLLYTFNSNIDQTKVLIIYKLQNLNDIYSENKFRIVIRYSGLNMISNSISQFMKKKINKEYAITKTIIIGAIQENMITIQSIYKNLDNIDNLNKQTINDISDEESEQLIEDIFKIVNNNKLNLFVNKLEDTNNKSNEILKNHCDTMKYLTMMDNEFNNNINNTVQKYLNEKIKHKKSFQVKTLCTELKTIYNMYKN